MTKRPNDLLTSLAQALFDKKAFNILVLDARGVSSLADYFLTAEGTSDRHVQTLCNEVVTALETAGARVYAVEGKRYGEWIAVDADDIVIHLFGPGWREKYELEELWRECQIVEVELQTTRK